jgi:two-component system CheB/CheR fusion protein
MNAPVSNDPRSNNTAVTRIVALGASAGGLEALEQFLANVPVASGLAYVVVQHLDPTHKAMLAELLQRATAMPVHEATASMPVRPDRVYVIPPNTELTVVGGRLHLAVPVQPRGLRLPIDLLFCSLARDQGERAIGVVLSGMGADGTLGLQAIKSQGGLTLAQEPATAQFDSMPKSAIAASACDIVAPAAELPYRIMLVTSGRVAVMSSAVSPDEVRTQPLGAILNLLREYSKHDLTLYKTSTLRRRIERRMGVRLHTRIACWRRWRRWIASESIRT